MEEIDKNIDQEITLATLVAELTYIQGLDIDSDVLNKREKEVKQKILLQVYKNGLDIDNHMSIISELIDIETLALFTNSVVLDNISEKDSKVKMEIEELTKEIEALSDQIKEDIASSNMETTEDILSKAPVEIENKAREKSNPAKRYVDSKVGLSLDQTISLEEYDAFICEIINKMSKNIDYEPSDPDFLLGSSISDQIAMINKTFKALEIIYHAMYDSKNIYFEIIKYLTNVDESKFKLFDKALNKSIKVSPAEMMINGCSKEVYNSIYFLLNSDILNQCMIK